MAVVIRQEPSPAVGVPVALVDSGLRDAHDPAADARPVVGTAGSQMPHLQEDAAHDRRDMIDVVRVAQGLCVNVGPQGGVQLGERDVVSTAATRQQTGQCGIADVAGDAIASLQRSRSFSEYRQAEHIAWAAPGVTKVSNNLLIGP
jgi:hypothetical protein